MDGRFNHHYNIPYYSYYSHGISRSAPNPASERGTEHAHHDSDGADMILDHDYESIDLADLREDDRPTSNTSRNYYNADELVQRSDLVNNEGVTEEEEAIELDVYPDSAHAGSQVSLDHDYESIDLNDVTSPQDNSSLEHYDYIQFIAPTDVRQGHANEKTPELEEKKTAENNKVDDKDDDAHVYVSIISSGSDASGKTEDGNGESEIHHITSEHDYLSLRGDSHSDIRNSNPTTIPASETLIHTGTSQQPNYVNLFHRGRVGMASDSYEHVYARADNRDGGTLEHESVMDDYAKIKPDLQNDYESITDIIHSRQQIPVQLPERKRIYKDWDNLGLLNTSILVNCVILVTTPTEVRYRPCPAPTPRIPTQPHATGRSPPPQTHFLAFLVRETTLPRAAASKRVVRKNRPMQQQLPVRPLTPTHLSPLCHSRH